MREVDMIYTSYYGNPNIPENSIKIQISNTRPKGYFVHAIWDTVFPDWTLINQIKEGSIDEVEYSRRYNSSLEYNKDFILKETERISSLGDTIVLLCYEKSENFCHRHLLSDFLNRNLNISIKELA